MEKCKIANILEMATVEQNGVKFGLMGCLVTSRWGTFAPF